MKSSAHRSVIIWVQVSVRYRPSCQLIILDPAPAFLVKVDEGENQLDDIPVVHTMQLDEAG